MTTTTTDFTGFYHANFADTVMLAYLFTADMPAAQDVAQEAFTRAWQRWSSLSGYDNPLAWVRRVCINLTNSRWRRLRTAQAFLQRQREEYVEELNPDHVAVVAALRKLPRNHREAIVMHYLADMPIEEVAQQLEAPLGSVKSWLHRGRSALAEALVIEVPRISTPPAEQIIKRAQRRSRVRTAQIAAVTVVILAGGLAAFHLLRPASVQPAVSPSPSPALPAGCQAGQVPVSLRLPDQESDVKVDVFNATNVAGLATTVASDLRDRKFIIGQVNDAPDQRREDVAVIRYGPRTIGAAHLLNAYTLGEATMEFDLARTTDTVDLLVAERFRQLATSAEMRQAIALMGRPELPPGTCALPQ
jgi:RNA polymerase sigma-70 factor (sigma-E family)